MATSDKSRAIDAPMCKVCKTRHFGINHDLPKPKRKVKRGKTTKATAPNRS